MKKEYSVVGEELQEIMELILNGYEYETFESNDTLYLRLVKGNEKKEFDHVSAGNHRT